MDLELILNQNLFCLQTRKKTEKMKLPSLFGTTMEFSVNAKFIRLILDMKLNWKKHIQERINKATQIFWQCKRAYSKNWSLKPNVIHRLYTTRPS